MIDMALQPWPLVRRGDKAHPVPSLQYLLRARGHIVTVDGDFGPKTEAAVRAYQKEKNLAVDGVVGPQTWRALVITARRGDQGDAVRAVQEEFQYRNLSGDPNKGLQVDGIFGPKTETAVRDWQQLLHDNDEPGMAVDGIVGPMTWQSLISGMYAG
jgi:murein L,D-transpeptidase YcbB/YkuD